MSMNPRLVRFKGVSANLGATGEIELDFGGAAPTGGTSRVVKFELVRLKIRRTGGTAANFTPIVVEATGATTGDIEEVYTGPATAVGTLFDQSPSGKVGRTNAAGKAFLIPGWDADVDNDCNYEVYVKVWL